jgi:hypothetical protein
LPPLSGASQAVESEGACARDRADKPALENVGAYFNYAPPETLASEIAQGKNPPKEGEPTHLDGVFPISQPGNVPLRSKPVAITPVTNRSGTISYRVTGTLKPRTPQQREFRQNLDDAQALQVAWECKRMANGAEQRFKYTRLTQAELGQAETAVETLRGTGATLFDAAMYYRLHGPKAGTSKTMEELVQSFLAERETFVSTAQFENLRLTGEWFRDHIGGTTPLSSITTEQVQAWLKGRNVANKTYNTYRNDLSTIFAWACAVPREWLKTNPVQAVPRYGQKQLSKGRPEVMKIETCQALMATLEKEYPEWCCFFAVAMFSGIRPDINLGEMSKLAKCVGRDGIGTYLNGDHWHLTPEITKDRRHRDTRIKPNLKEWLAKYPPTPENLCPGKPTVYAEIRERFAIPYDGLRHTCISAFVAAHGSLAEAAMEFGNSEAMILRHYLRRFSKEDAHAFYNIRPSALPRVVPVQNVVKFEMSAMQ